MGVNPNSTPHSRGVDRNGRTDRRADVPIAVSVTFCLRSFVLRSQRSTHQLTFSPVIITLSSHLSSQSVFQSLIASSSSWKPFGSAITFLPSVGFSPFIRGYV